MRRFYSLLAAFVLGQACQLVFHILSNMFFQSIQLGACAVVGGLVILALLTGALVARSDDTTVKSKDLVPPKMLAPRSKTPVEEKETQTYEYQTY